MEGKYALRDWNVDTFTLTGNLNSVQLTGFHLKDEDKSFRIDGQVPLQPENEINLMVEGNIDLELLSQFLHYFLVHEGDFLTGSNDRCAAIDALP